MIRFLQQNLWVRLALVALVLIVGVFAIVQSLGLAAGVLPGAEENAPNTPAAEAEDPAPPSETGALDPPLSRSPVVRANNDDDDYQAASLAPPPSQPSAQAGDSPYDASPMPAPTGGEFHAAPIRPSAGAVGDAGDYEPTPAAEPRATGNPFRSGGQQPQSAQQPSPIAAQAEPTAPSARLDDRPNANDQQPEPAKASPADRYDSPQYDAAYDEPRRPASQYEQPAFDSPRFNGADQPAPLAAIQQGRRMNPAVSADINGDEGSGVPGPPSLEGVQTPTVMISKAAPAEIQVGKQATFQIQVRNVGKATAHNVVVQDETPRGVRFVDSTPRAEPTPDGKLIWKLGALAGGEERTISLHVMPIKEGELGSVATVSFDAQASVRTLCTRPLLQIEQTLPREVLIGQPVKISIRLSNPGSGAATGVVLEEDVPEGLSHSAGRELEYEIGTLRPGETRSLELTLTAAQPGIVRNVLAARADANILVEDEARMEVIAPKLELAMTGPSKRYLDRQATYAISISNPGTATAHNIEVATRLPKGMKFVAADNQGQYDANSHAVYWSLSELPATDAGTVTVTTLPVEPGEQRIRVESVGDLELASETEQIVDVEGLAALGFEVIDLADPIEVGRDTIYQVKIINQGSKAASNVRLAALLPPEMQPVAGDGPTAVSVSGQNVTAAPLARLAPREDAIYKLQVRGLRAGDQRIRVQVTSDEIRTPITKEESTRVYSDE